MIACDPHEPFEYELKTIPADGEVFLLHPITAKAQKKIKGWARSGNAVDYDIAQLGLAGWQGLKDADGNEVEFVAGKDSLATEESMMRLLPDAWTELALAYTKRGNLTEEDLKNLR